MSKRTQKHAAIIIGNLDFFLSKNFSSQEIEVAFLLNLDNFQVPFYLAWRKVDRLFVLRFELGVRPDAF